MKNLLNNPLVVAMLAVVAVAVVYVQVFDPIMQSPKAMPLMAVQASGVITEDNAIATDRHTSLGWSQEMFRSNPFASRQGLEKEQQGNHQKAAVEDIYKLSAILIGAKQPLAWVGGKLVGIGDVVGDMRVAAIASERVLLRGKKGQRILKLSSPMAGGSHHE